MLFAGVERVYGSQNAPMLWHCIIAGIKEHLKAIGPINPPPRANPLALGVFPDQSGALAHEIGPSVGL
jgi:hypothetical protein